MDPAQGSPGTGGALNYVEPEHMQSLMEIQNLAQATRIYIKRTELAQNIAYFRHNLDQSTDRDDQ